MGRIADFDDERRLEALDRYRVLDTPDEDCFDRLTRLCAELLDVPIALVSLVDKERQWFKSRVGLEARSTDRSVAFCDHAIREPAALVIEDATRDPRFARNPLVTQPPGIRFYAGVPLRTPDGHALGTLCAIDRRPRTLSDAQRRVLEQLAHQVELELELRRSEMTLRSALEDERSRQRHKETLAAMVVHDLRSPLTGIALSALASLEQDTAATRTNLLFIADAARRAQSMLSNLLDLCLSEFHGLATRPVPLTTMEVVEAAVQQVTPYARVNRVEVVCDGSNTEFEGDPDLLRRALVNVIENAIRVSPVDAQVRCRASATDDRAVIAVEDFGPGICDADKDRVFAPLEQGPSQTQGMRGLGLAFCASAVHAHDGLIRVEDNTPRGTCVVIELPRSGSGPPTE